MFTIILLHVYDFNNYLVTRYYVLIFLYLTFNLIYLVKNVAI